MDLPNTFSSIAVLIGIAFSATGCAATEVHQQGGSTAVITQSGGGGPSSTRVIKTPDGQKIITRDGSNVDITIQRNSSSGRGIENTWEDRGDERRATARDRFTRRPSDCSKEDGGFFGALRRFWSSDKCNDPSEEDIPTSEEYKSRMLRRMRPLSTP